jgi:hypothetical protein
MARFMHFVLALPLHVERITQMTKHLVIALVLFVAPAALADSFQLTTNSSAPITIANSTAGENIYESPHSGRIHTIVQSFGNGGVMLPNSSLSFTAPEGTAIISATLTLTVPRVVDGTAVLTTAGVFSSPDIDQPRSSPPVLDNPGTAQFLLDAVLGTNNIGGIGASFCDVCDISNYLVISGNTVSILPLSSTVFSQNLFIAYGALMSTGVAVQATNWNGYIDGVASGEIPYTLQLSGTYEVTPEPSNALLMATGLVGLCGYMFRNKAGQILT